MSKKVEIKEVSIDELNKLIFLLGKIKLENPSEVKSHTIDLAIAILNSYLSIISILNKKNSSIKKLKAFIFGAKSEKSSKINKKEESKEEIEKESEEASDISNELDENDSNPPANTSSLSTSFDKKDAVIIPPVPPTPPKKKRDGGGGKNGQEKYTGATDVDCPLVDDHKNGNTCPSCNNGKLAELDPKIHIKIIGKPPLEAVRFTQEVSACDNCGQEFFGAPPGNFKALFEEEDKYSPSAIASIITQKFDMGVPYGSLEKLEKMFGIPLPASTQANKVIDHTQVIEAINSCLETEAANKDIIIFDDTGHRLLNGEKDSTGEIIKQKLHASVFVCKNIVDCHPVILYNINIKHAGISLKELLKLRVNSFEDLCTISDGLLCYGGYLPINSKNSNCNVHSRRNFIYEKIAHADFFRIKMIGYYQDLYKNEKHCTENKLNANERLLYHQKNSTVIMDNILGMAIFMMTSVNSDLLGQMRIDYSIPDHIFPCEPNSDLYKGADYIFKRKTELTNFLRFPGVPLDTNEVERKVKAVIEMKKKGFFFYSPKSALFAGKILSIIETVQEGGGNSYSYIEFIIRHEKQVLASPRDYLPWNYKSSQLYQNRMALS